MRKFKLFNKTSWRNDVIPFYLLASLTSKSNRILCITFTTRKHRLHRHLYSCITKLYCYITKVRFDVYLASSSYSYFPDICIHDGREGNIKEFHFNGVTDVNKCYRLCLETLSNCDTFR